MGHYHPLYMPNEPMGTSSLSILDEDGMAVALTTTINLNFGSMLYDTGTGIILNSQMDVSRYNPVKGLFDSWLTPNPCREGGAPL